MKLSAKSYLLYSACSLAGFMLLYYACFLYSCGKYIRAEWWIKDVYAYKHFLNEIIKSPRIIIAGGSNALFGINSDIIEKTTGRNVFNIASHAGLDLNFHYLKLKQYMNNGDIIVIPLEYNYYYKDDGYTEWFIDNMTAWGKEEYIDKLNVIDLFKFIYHVQPSRVYEGLFNKQKPPTVNKDIVIISTVKSLYSGWQGYSFKSMNKYGEINIDAQPEDTLVEAGRKGIVYLKNRKISDNFLLFMHKVNRLARERNGKIVLTWPPSIRNKYFDLANDNHRDRVDAFIQELQRQDISIYCDPRDFNMDIQYFSNTEYHLNSSGAMIRSELLGRCLNDILQQ